jgi:hypothetical protein
VTRVEGEEQDLEGTPATANASPVEIWTCNGGTNQKWTRSQRPSMVGRHPAGAAAATMTLYASPSGGGTSCSSSQQSGVAALMANFWEGRRFATGVADLTKAMGDHPAEPLRGVRR